MTKMQTTPMELNAGAQSHGKQVMTWNRKATLPVSMYHMNEHGMNISHSRTRRQRRVKSIQSMAAMDVDQPQVDSLHASAASVDSDGTIKFQSDVRTLFSEKEKAWASRVK